MKRNSKTKPALMALALAALMIPAIVAAARTEPQQPPQQPRPLTGNAANGKILYFTHGCYGCHGFNGETGRRLQGSTTGILNNETNFIRFLRARADVAPLLPSTAMPNYPVESLSDAQAKDIYAHIRSFKSTAPELKDIPALNAIIAGASRPYKP
jgi:mono/diheme cytochrome c family protein